MNMRTNRLDDLPMRLVEEDDLVRYVKGLIEGTIQWNDIDDELGVDVETGNPIPNGATEA